MAPMAPMAPAAPAIRLLLTLLWLCTGAYFLRRLFRCRHPHCTFPQTHRDRDGRRLPPYRACLDCGAHLPFHGFGSRPHSRP